MELKRLILDFDDTITLTSKCYCDTYTMLYGSHPQYKKPDWTKNDKWNFDIECSLEKHPEDIFKNQLFFDNLEFQPYAKQVIERLSNYFQIIICTIGTHRNNALKILWLEKNLPIVQNIVPIVNESVKMDKSIVNMSQKGTIFVDDNHDNLFSSNAPRKILFKPFNRTLPWNKDWTGEVVTSWPELEKLLLNS